MKRNMRQHLISLAALSLFAAGSTWAAGGTTLPPTEKPAGTMHTQPADGMRAGGDAIEHEKDQLEQKLQAGQTRADYARILETEGYRISSINADKKDYLEYEVVKGDHSYEVQLDFDKGAARATKIDVANNMWRADATKKMLANADYKHPAPLVADPSGQYSDRRNMKAWTGEKDRLEKALPPNMQVAQYRPKLEQLGYKVTAVNDRDADYLEYEIAKGKNSYEVQIDVDPKTKMATKVDVTSNLWEADGTERATDHAKR